MIFFALQPLMVQRLITWVSLSYISFEKTTDPVFCIFWYVSPSGSWSEIIISSFNFIKKMLLINWLTKWCYSRKHSICYNSDWPIITFLIISISVHITICWLQSEKFKMCRFMIAISFFLFMFFLLFLLVFSQGLSSFLLFLRNKELDNLRCHVKLSSNKWF